MQNMQKYALATLLMKSDAKSRTKFFDRGRNDSGGSVSLSGARLGSMSP